MQPFFKGRILERTVEAVPQGVADLASGGPVLDLLAERLKDSRWHGAMTRILVSNVLVRYAVIPAGSQLLEAEDEVALARLKFQQVHGGALADWEVRLGGLLSGKDQVAAAFERVWLDRLRAILGAARLRVRSIEPLLMRAFNRSRGRIKGSSFWFAHAEPDLLMLARVQDGNWVSLTGTQLQSPLARVLPAQVREARLLEGGSDSPRRIYLCAHGLDCDGIDPGADIELVDVAKSRLLRYTTAECSLGLALGG